MPKKTKTAKPLKFERAKRVRLSADESLKRMQSFPKRQERFIAALGPNLTAVWRMKTLCEQSTWQVNELLR